MKQKEEVERIDGKIVLYYDDSKRAEYLSNANSVLNYCNHILGLISGSKLFIPTVDLVKAFSFVHIIEEKEEIEKKYSGGVGLLKTPQLYKINQFYNLNTTEDEKIAKEMLLAEIGGANTRVSEMIEKELLKDYETLKKKCYDLRQKFRIDDKLSAVDFSIFELKDGCLMLTGDFLDRAKKESAVLADTKKAENLFLALRKIEHILNTEVWENMNSPEYLPKMLNATRMGFGFTMNVNYNLI